MKEDPTSAEEVIQLAKWARSRKDPPYEPEVFVSYLVSQCGANRLPLKNLLLPIWPEAAAFIEGITPEEMHRFVMMLMPRGETTRLAVIAMLEGAAKARELHPSSVEPLLEEFDALTTPKQLPDAIRERAYWRNRRALALFPHLECQ